MKTLAAVAVLCLLPLAAQAAPRAEPKFADYPAAVYRGARKNVVIDNDTREYRTKFRETNAMPISFAGHYVVNSFGCGTGALPTL